MSAPLKVMASKVTEIIHLDWSSWYNTVGKIFSSVWDRRKEILYCNASVCMARQNNHTPECILIGTECYDSWVWAIYLFILYWRPLLKQSKTLLFGLSQVSAVVLFFVKHLSVLVLLYRLSLECFRYHTCRYGSRGRSRILQGRGLTQGKLVITLNYCHPTPNHRCIVVITIGESMDDLPHELCFILCSLFKMSKEAFWSYAFPAEGGHLPPWLPWIDTRAGPDFCACCARSLGLWQLCGHSLRNDLGLPIERA